MGMRLERRQHGEHLQVGLGRLSLLATRGQLSREHTVEAPGLVGGRVEDAQEQQVVSHHVDVLGAPDHAAGRGEVGR